MLALEVEDAEVLASVVKHARVARRIRIFVPGLLGDDLLAARIERSVKTQPGVDRVQASSRTGRVLIVYRDGAAILDRLDSLAATGATPPPPPPARAREAGGVAPSRPEARPETAWHAMPAATVMQRIGTSSEGLSAAEAAARLRSEGPNLLETTQSRSRWQILGSQFANLPSALLIGSAVLTLLLGDLFDAGAIAAVLAMNAGIGYTIERRHESMLSSWRRLEAGQAQVLRGGRLETILTADLVTGDVLVCRAGDVLPADARVIHSDRLACDESSLTGESEAQRKSVEPVDAGAPLAERTCLLHAGTLVTTGSGRAVVVATGRRTEMAQVRALVEGSNAPRTPLEKRLHTLANRATIASLGAAVVSATAGLLHRGNTLSVLKSAVALGVAAIPEGLPLIATTTLIQTMNRMRKAGMVVRRVASAETLGSVTVVCADKTGTLTRNEMRVETLEVDSGRFARDQLIGRCPDPLSDPLGLALAIGVLNSDVDLYDGAGGMALSGSSTEQALIEAAVAAGLDPHALRRSYPRQVLVERQEGIHHVTTVHDRPEGGSIAFIKGAPEQVLALCPAGFDGAVLDDAGRRRWMERNDELAGRGLRVLALGWTPAQADAPPAQFRFVGLVAMRDPLRDGAAEALETAARAGIRTIILTGDQRRTTEAIAAQVGLRGAIVDGPELERVLVSDPAGVTETLQTLAALCRVTPAQKLAVVRALQARGEVVAMVGDGVNDSPALKAADIGIAVGGRASDLARQTADLVMENEDLRSILMAVGEGRLAAGNLRRTIRFLFATNLSEVLLMVAGWLFGRPLLTPFQLLWINLLTDSLPALALALERGDAAALLGRPAADEMLSMRRAWSDIALDAAGIAATAGTVFAAAGSDSAFATLVGAQLGYALVRRRSERAEADRPSLYAAVGASAALQLGALTVPPLRALLGLGGPVLGPALGLLAGLCLPTVVNRLVAAVPGSIGPGRRESPPLLLPMIN
jgi:Ca2+-transporting ATPase